MPSIAARSPSSPGSPVGLTVSLLFYAHNVPIGVLVNLINEGLATVQVSKRHGQPGIEVTTLRISDKGRKAIG